MKLKLICQTCIAVVIALSLGAVATAQQPPVEFDFDIQKIEADNNAGGPGGPAVWFQRAVDLSGVKPSSHWMGVVVRPVDPLLKKHLKIDGGLIVQHVTPDSPAAKAGVQTDDILLAVNDSEVADFKGLMEFLTENEDQKVTVWLLREGKKQSVKLTPVKRPQAHEKFFQAPELGRWDFQGKDPEEVRKWIEEMTKQKLADGAAAGRAWQLDGKNPLKMRFFHPGVILGGDVDVDVEIGDLPEGLQVIVIKQGNKPAQIKVKRGEEEWEVTEKELDKLPEDVREHVKKHLGAGPRLGFRIEKPRALQIKPLEGRVQRAMPRIEARAIQIDGGGNNIEKKLDQIDQRLEKIEQALEKLAK